MHDWESLAHVRWECKYHVVIIPKFRRKVLYGRLRRQVGRILRELCAQRGVEAHRREGDGGSCSFVSEHSTQVQRCAHDRLLERECRADSPESVAGASDDRAALLVDGLLRQHDPVWMKDASASIFVHRNNLRPGKGTWISNRKH